MTMTVHCMKCNKELPIDLTREFSATKTLEEKLICADCRQKEICAPAIPKTNHIITNEQTRIVRVEDEGKDWIEIETVTKRDGKWIGKTIRLNKEEMKAIWTFHERP